MGALYAWVFVGVLKADEGGKGRELRAILRVTYVFQRNHNETKVFLNYLSPLFRANFYFLILIYIV